MAIVIVLGTALIVYSRQSAPSRNTAPTINDHWHVSYGFYKCNGFLNDLTGTLEEPVTPEYQKYNIHSHDDGVIHWHAGALAAGTRAKLGVFLDSYGIKVSTDGITFPANQNNGESYKTSDLKCKNAEGKMVDAQVQVVVWDQYDNTEVSMKYITDFDNIRIKKDGMAITMAIAAPGAEIPMPKSAANLPELGAADMGGVTTTTVKGATTTTVKGATTTTAG